MRELKSEQQRAMEEMQAHVRLLLRGNASGPLRENAGIQIRTTMNTMKKCKLMFGYHLEEMLPMASLLPANSNSVDAVFEKRELRSKKFSALGAQRGECATLRLDLLSCIYKLCSCLEFLKGYDAELCLAKDKHKFISPRISDGSRDFLPKIRKFLLLFCDAAMNISES
ncbi:hypothetical protein LguiB_027658 [Lonicera macranthoides]